MLRKLVVTTAALGLSLGIAATATAQSITVGAQAGLNVANVSADAGVFSVNTDTKTGFWGGIFAEFGITPIFAVRPEALYTSKGFKLSDQGDEFELSVNYFQIPLLFEAVIPIKDSPIRPVVFAGPAVGFETKCDLSVSSGGVSATVDCDDPDDGFVERATTDWSIIFGGEVGYQAAKVIPFVGVRYDLGLTNLDNSNDPDSIKNKTWTFYGGIGLPVK
jgi:hypothetical protein